MKYEIKKTEYKTVLFLKGVVGLRECQDLKMKVMELSRETSGLLLLDLNQVDLMDSSGLGAIVYCHNKISSDGKRLCIVNNNSKIDLLFGVTNAHKILEIYDDEVGLVA